MNNKIAYLILGVVVLGILGVLVWALQKQGVIQEETEKPIITDQETQELIKPIVANFSYDKQTVGEPTDGAQLKEIRYTDHSEDGYYRIVFDFGDHYEIPASEAVYARSAKTITLTMNGVRQDNSGSKINEPVMINDDYVVSYTKRIIKDDSAIEYTIALNKDAKFYLHALKDPIRIILDVQDLGKDSKLQVKVYFIDTEAARTRDCRITKEFARIIPYTEAVATAAINEMLKGPNAQEAKTVHNSIPEGTKLLILYIENDTAYAEFSKEIQNYGGGSCSAGAIRAQIENTLMQFPTVDRVEISVPGVVYPLQP